MNGGWTTVRVQGAADRSAVARALFGLGAESLQEIDDGFVTHMRGIDRALVSAAVARADTRARTEYAPTPDVDWSAAWRAGISAHRVGKLVVTPPWLADEFAARERIVVDPGMAFGTGEHETTRGVLRLLAQLIEPGDHVADLGTGSAVLAIAAARLGAARVIAIEIDPDAIGNAEANVASNDVGDRVTVIEGDAALLLPLVAPVRVVIANIISSVLLELLPVIEGALQPNGVAVLAGMLAEERARMEETWSAAGWRTRASDLDGQWWSAAIAR